MKLLKNFLLISIIIIAIIACDDNNGITVDDFDHAGQALIDDETLVKYLESHHYIPPSGDDIFGTIDTILPNETVTSLLSHPMMNIQNITENDIQYKLYYLTNNIGADKNPSKADSVLVNYRGFTLDSVKFDERINYTWFSLTNVVRGWSYGFEHFKDGNNTTQPNAPISFSNTGNGILFFPSGLGYRNVPQIGIQESSPLIFFINLGLVERADHDNDLILSIDEDVDNNFNVNNDDSDGDRLANYIDIDDDNDGVLTRDEDVDRDGNPLNDDTDGDGIKNYLDTDDDGDGKLTINESKTQDKDGDGIVDYLDPDTN